MNRSRPGGSKHQIYDSENLLGHETNDDIAELTGDSL